MKMPHLCNQCLQCRWPWQPENMPGSILTVSSMNAMQGLMWLCSIEELQGPKNANIGDSA